ncbi:MAG: patatin-like phospholipase family protein [Halioglobus sp.]
MPVNQILLRMGISLLAALMGACSTIYKTENQAITQVDESSGYRRFDQSRTLDVGDTRVLLAFSGGGTRAAALSYGVMKELRDTLVESDNKTARLLDEVDAISSVSGGSFTAAYYGLFGDSLFESYEEDFLRRDVQKSLIKGVLNPMNWIKGAFSAFDRKEMTIEYYDQTVFKGATFADFRTEEGPFIEINATDLATGLRFTFNQERFDLICTDLSSYSVARAVTASSAVPVAFPTVVLENHADKCDVSQTESWRILENVTATGEAQSSLQQGLKSYRDVENRKYIHLVDGGIADNLGLRAALDRVESLGETRFLAATEKPVKNIVFILVNAGVETETTMEQSAKNPSAGATMGAFTSAQIARYSQETLDKVRQNIEELNQRFSADGIPTTIYFSEVSFEEVADRRLNKVLNTLPTSLELDDNQIDQLVTAGRILLRQEPSYRRFLQNNEGRLAEGAMSNTEICNYFSMEGCAR